MRTKCAVIVSMLSCLLLTGCGILGPLFELEGDDATQQAQTQSAAGEKTTSSVQPGVPAQSPVHRKATRIVLAPDWEPTLETIEEDSKGAGEVSNENASTNPQAKSQASPDPVEAGGNLLISVATILPPPWNVIVGSAAGVGVTWWTMNRKRKRPASTQHTQHGGG